MPDHKYQVKWPELSVPTPKGGFRVLKAGDSLPDTVPEARAAVLSGIGAVVMVGPAPEAPAITQVPSLSASKADWEAYAVARGWTAADAKKATKKELQKKLGAPAAATEPPPPLGPADDPTTPPAPPVGDAATDGTTTYGTGSGAGDSAGT